MIYFLNRKYIILQFYYFSSFAPTVHALMSLRHHILILIVLIMYYIDTYIIIIPPVSRQKQRISTNNDVRICHLMCFSLFLNTPYHLES